MATEKGTIIARGRTAEIFTWGNNRVLKLFLDGCPAAWAEQEARVTQAVHETGLPVPAVEGIVEVESRLGIVFERVEGHSMLGVLGAKPWKLVQFARLLAELQAAMHSREIAGFPLQRERLESNIQAAEVLPATTREAVLNLLRRLPDGNAVCHGDFHPDNIIMSSRGPIIIDWLTATQGNPLADVARTWLLLRVGAPPGAGVVSQRLSNLGSSLLYSICLKRYLRLHPASGQQIDAWKLPVAAARLSENIPEENARLLAFVEAGLRQRKS